MKRILIALFLMMFCANAYGAVVETRVTGGTADFLSATRTITFNSVTTHIYLRNESNDDCFVNVKCKDTDDYTGSAEYYTVEVPNKGVSPSSVEFDFSTKKLSFWGGASGSGTIVYILTGEVEDL